MIAAKESAAFVSVYLYLNNINSATIYKLLRKESLMKQTLKVLIHNTFKLYFYYFHSQ